MRVFKTHPLICMPSSIALAAKAHFPFNLINLKFCSYKLNTRLNAASNNFKFWDLFTFDCLCQVHIATVLSFTTDFLICWTPLRSENLFVNAKDPTGDRPTFGLYLLLRKLSLWKHYRWRWRRFSTCSIFNCSLTHIAKQNPFKRLLRPNRYVEDTLHDTELIFAFLLSWFGLLRGKVFVQTPAGSRGVLL